MARDGKRGSERHQDLENLVRFGTLTVLRERRGAVWGTVDGGLPMAMGIPREESGRCLYPDAMLCPDEHTDPQALFVEIGEYDLGKWPASVPVLHVTLTGRASLLNSTGREFDQEALDVTNELLAYTAAGLSLEQATQEAVSNWRDLAAWVSSLFAEAG